MMTKEKIQHHINHLAEKHSNLHKIIEALEAEHAPDNIISIRKKEKLALKDEITSLRKKADSL